MDPLEPQNIEQPTSEIRNDSRPVNSGEKDTKERAKMPHSEMCEKNEVTSVTKRHDVDGRHAPKSDETAG